MLNNDTNILAVSNCYSKLYPLLLESAVDKLGITTKRTTYKYHLPTSVVKSGAKASVIKHETFNVDWSKEKVDLQARLAAVVSQLLGPSKLTIKLCNTGTKQML